MKKTNKSFIKRISLIIVFLIMLVLFAISINSKQYLNPVEDVLQQYTDSNLPYKIRVLKEIITYGEYDNQIDPLVSDDNDVLIYCTQPNTPLYEGEQGSVFIKSQNEKIYNQNDSFSDCNDNMYDIGYIVSSREGGLQLTDWSGYIQHAIWRSNISSHATPDYLGKHIYSYNGLYLYHESQWYKSFYEKIVARSSQDDPKMNPTNQTNNDEVVTLSSTDNKTQTVGPFKVDYVNETNDGKLVKFSGISDMYLVDDAGNKIDITNIQTENLHYYYADSYNPAGLTTDYYLNNYLDNSQIASNLNDYQKYAYCKWHYIKGMYINRGLSFEQYAAGKGVYKKWKNYGKPSYFPATEGGAPDLDYNLQDYWDFLRFYPDSNENFYVEYDTSQKIVGSLHLHVEFAWLKAEGNFTFRRSASYNATDNEVYTFIGRGRDIKQTEGNLVSTATQSAIIVTSAKRSRVKESLDIYFPNTNKDTTMSLGGYVFEDISQGKDDVTNGTMDSNDRLLKNIKVTLYEQNSDGSYTESNLAKCISLLATEFTIPGVTDENRYDTNEVIELAKKYVATLDSNKDSDLINKLNQAIEKSQSEEDYSKRTNPTYTDSNGYYEFRGINMSKKYIVKFTYNGQDYIPTDYLTTNANEPSEVRYNSVQDMVKANIYSGDNENSSEQENSTWKVTSKGTELDSERTNYNNKFAEIGSYPCNYVSSNSLGYLTPSSDSKTYNETFSSLELMGYTLSTEGKYSQTAIQLADGYLKDENSTDTATYKEGAITQNIKKFIEDNKKYPNDSELKTIYNNISNGDATIQKEIQFIEDCKMNSWTKNSSDEFDQYSVYNNLTTNSKNVTISKVTSAEVSDYDGATVTATSKNVKSKTESKTTYYSIYNGQLEVNQGLYKRPKADLALRKDVAKVETTIRGKKETYIYNKKVKLDTDAKGGEYWEINTRVSDNSYYGTTYSRKVYPSDYNYGTDGLTTDSLQMNVTYKITLRNQAMTLDTNVMELVDYYDSEYTLTDIYVGDIDGNKLTDDVKAYDGSKYISGKKQIDGYNNAYIRFGDSGMNIKSGSSKYVYLTFSVNKNNNKLILDDNDIGKENVIEINGYKTFYQDNTKLPNSVTKSSNDIAGLIDIDSKPGNVDNTVLKKNSILDYTKFEDDTDKAPNIKITLYGKDEERNITGTVWEENRDTSVENSKIGDGIKQDTEKKIQGIKVQLIDTTTKEVASIYDYDEEIWKPAETMTDENGVYNFSGYIPGTYKVRFIYGDTGDGSTYNGYNAQDYKSTIYNDEQAGFNYTDPNADLVYDYTQAEKDDADKVYKSDARDDYQIRQTINNYCNNNGNDVSNNIAQELSDSKNNSNLKMTSDSAIINVETEYNRTISQLSTDGLDVGDTYVDTTSSNLDNYTKSGNYKIGNLDFGLVERPKAQIELLKYVTNVKVTLANGNNLFDATQKQTNAIWVDKEYTNPSYTNGIMANLASINNARNDATKKGKIQLTIDSELLHSATIKVTYSLIIANVGEVDYNDAEFYYTGKENGAEANIVRTRANAVIDYVGYQGTTDKNATRNNLKFNVNDNPDWATIVKDGEEYYYEYTDESSVKHKQLLTYQNKTVNGSAITNEPIYLSKDTYEKAISNYNTIIISNKMKKDLTPVLNDKDAQKIVESLTKPGTTVSDISNSVKDYMNNGNSMMMTTLVLSQTLSSENTSDDMTYNNMAEIISSNNTVGRRMAYSVVGNQDPTTEPAEVDSDTSQEITILPPFGQKHYAYYIAIGSAILLITGIVLIKKKVLGNK